MTVNAEEVFEALTSLDAFYASSDGLARSKGLSLNDKPDFEAIAAFIFDVFLNSRFHGLDVETAMQNVRGAVQQTLEWRSRHARTATTTPLTPFSRSLDVSQGEFLRAIHRLDVFYRSWNGLQRPHGLNIDGRPDFRAVAAWVFGEYLNLRLDGRTPEQAWDETSRKIQATPEWQTRPRLPVDASSLHGKHLMGYQGWFSTPQDGHNTGWDHWFRDGDAADLTGIKVDFWPDTRELFDSELAATSVKMKDDTAARLFSCYNPRTMRRHFDWMADAGIDGVSLGRFTVGTTTTASRDRLDILLKHMRVAAEATGRVFFVWYDCTGHPPATFVEDVKRDWVHVAQELRIVQSSRYLRHKGKPFVGIWGAGAEHRPGTPAEWLDLIAFLKTSASVLLGGISDWRTNTTWGPVFATPDVISGWAVNVFQTEEGADAFRTNTLAPDLAAAKLRNQDYLPIVFPGFSSANADKRPASSEFAKRLGGRFYWRQVFNTVDAGATNLFTAMFDEIDEGTAMFKMAETERDTPRDSRFGKFLTTESLPSDWYLRLGGAAGRMLRGEIPKTRNIPITP